MNPKDKLRRKFLYFLTNINKVKEWVLLGNYYMSNSCLMSEINDQDKSTLSTICRDVLDKWLANPGKVPNQLAAFAYCFSNHAKVNEINHNISKLRITWNESHYIDFLSKPDSILRGERLKDKKGLKDKNGIFSMNQLVILKIITNINYLSLH